MAKTKPSPVSTAPPSPSVSPVWALVGGDAFLQTQKIVEIAGKMGEKVDRLEFGGETAELSAVLDELRSLAMFAAAKLVVVREADDFVSRFRAEMETYVESPVMNAVLVLRLASLPKNTRLYKLLDKHGTIQMCEAPKSRELSNWIIDHARNAHGLTVAPPAAALLAELVGSDLGRIDQELARLAIEHGQKKPPRIEVADVAATVSFQRELEMWALTDALTAGDTAKALGRWRQLLSVDSSAEYRAVTWLSIWLENLRKAIVLRAEGMPEFTIARICRVYDPKLVEGLFRTARRLGIPGIDHAVKRLTEMDRRIKSGLGEAADNVERFILTFADEACAI